jgi:hypothetical protein
LSTTTPLVGSSTRSTVEKLSTQTTASIASPRMTTSRLSEKSSPIQPSVPATTGKQRICHLSKSFVFCVRWFMKLLLVDICLKSIHVLEERTKVLQVTS